MLQKKIIKPGIVKKLMIVTGFLLLSMGSMAQLVNQNDTIILDRILAIVGGHPILQSDVEYAVLDFKARGMRIPGDEKCTMLEELIKTKLYLDQAELDSIEITDRQVEIRLQQQIDGIIQQAGGSVEMVEQHFNKSLPEIKKDFFDDAKEQMLTGEVQANITRDINVTPSEVQKFFRDIPKDQIPRIPEHIEIRQIVMKPKIAEEEKQKIIDQLNEFRDQIVGGKSMATLAILHSDDPGSRSQGGELGFLKKSLLDPAYTAAAYNLREGEISRVVKTEFGYHLIQLIERRGEEINTRHILLRPEVRPEEKQYTRNVLDSIAVAIRKGDMEFGKAALKFSSDEQSFANGGLMVNRRTGTTKFEPRELSPEVLVQIDDLEVGEVSSPFESQDEKMNTVYKIIMIESRQPAHEANIKTDYQFIQSLALDSKQAEELNEWLKDKQKSTYIRINEDYQGCDFRLEGWVK